MSRRSNQSVDVYDSEFESAIKVPRHLVHQIPSAYLNITRLVLCRNYNPKVEGSCEMGARCKFVHADLSDKAMVRTSSIHVNYAWKDIESVRYPRLPAGEILQVTAPNNRPPTDDIPSEFILKTKRSLAWQTTKGPLSHCAHFHFNRTCNRGEDCNFIHAIYIDATATEYQRAPAPLENLAITPQQYTKPSRGKTHTAKAIRVNKKAMEDSVSSQNEISESVSPCSSESSATCETRRPSGGYRHNPYSLTCAFVEVLKTAG